ncbi:MAG: GntR family transcriptional regulator [Alphaproteobacteria bacterium]|nr:GntR family transcriptional regulator [Alphaproteobacteria bacterium]
MDGPQPRTAPQAAPETQRVRSANLHATVVTRLRDLIVEGELPPGARLAERLLCERFGISRTPLREAFKVLASEGLVELLPNRGARVAPLDEADIENMFEVMAALEALAGSLACARIEEAELAEIGALHYEMLAQYTRRNLPDYFRLNQAIHAAIVAAARNPVLTATYQGLAARIRRARYSANLSDERWRQAVSEHEAILAALQARDGAGLARLLEAHLRNKSAVLRGGTGTVS